MAHDVLQIALEHHRAGRLTQAEAGYRAALERDPDDAGALHWLGVLTFQAGRAAEAVGLLERSVAGRPDDAAFQHNLGQAYLAAGRAAAAVRAFERAVAIDAGRGETLAALGQALLARRGDGDAEAAWEALRRAQAAGADSAEFYDLLGGALLTDERADEAIEAFRAAVKRKPDFAAALYHQALAHRARGEPKEVRRSLIRALEIEPQFARAWHALATLDAEAGNLDIAAGLFRKAIKAQPDYEAAYRGLAEVLRRAGRAAEAEQALELAERAVRGELGTHPAEAPTTADRPHAGSVADLERRLTPEPAAADLHFALATMMSLPAPAQVPSQSVADLFDRYAGSFDEHLRGKLGYRAPELIAAAVAANRPSADLMDILDLGCGTGLCGPLLRQMVKILAGVDLSPAMIDKARERGVYDRLEVGDLIEVVRRAPRAYDLLLAADVFVYLGDLAPTFEAAMAALRPGGLLVFTVEAAADTDRYQLQHATRRYAHSEAYLRRLAAMYGFEIRSLAAIEARVDAGRPVSGYLLVLRKDSAPP